jgi:hypothetical protein
MRKWWWERWRRGGERLRRDEPRAHQAMVEAEAYLEARRAMGAATDGTSQP